MITLNLEAQNVGNHTKIVIYLAGFHSSQFAEGIIFLSKDEALKYCEDKVIYVKPVRFHSRESAMNFINTEIKAFINKVKDFGFPDYFEKALSELECLEIIEYVKTNKEQFI